MCIIVSFMIFIKPNIVPIFNTIIAIIAISVSYYVFKMHCIDN